MKAVAYCRISNAEEREGSHSIDGQRADIDRFCSAGGIELAEVFTDHAGIGFSEERPELDRIKAGEIPEGTEAVIVASTDRIAGNMKQFLFLKQQLMSKGMEIKCVEENSGESGAGKFAPMLGRA